MGRKRKKELKAEEIETLDMDDNGAKEKKSGIKSTIFLVISIVLLLLSLGTLGYLYHENQKIESEITSSKESIEKVKNNITANEKTITEKKDEYEKLKEKVKDSLEELNIWEELKEELNKSLS